MRKRCRVRKIVRDYRLEREVILASHQLQLVTPELRAHPQIMASTRDLVKRTLPMDPLAGAEVPPFRPARPDLVPSTLENPRAAALVRAVVAVLDLVAARPALRRHPKIREQIALWAASAADAPEVPVEPVDAAEAYKHHPSEITCVLAVHEWVLLSPALRAHPQIMASIRELAQTILSESDDGTSVGGTSEGPVAFVESDASPEHPIERLTVLFRLAGYEAESRSGDLIISGQKVFFAAPV